MELKPINLGIKSIFQPQEIKAVRTYESRTVVNQRKIEALDWIRRAGISFPIIIDQIDGAKTKKLTEKIVRDGFVKKTRVYAPYQVEEAPKYFLTLTLSGLKLIDQINIYNFNYKEKSRKIDLEEIQHAFITQNLTINALNAKKIKNFKTEKEIGRKSESSMKQPDCTWFLENGKRIGLEVEISEKRGDRFGHFVYSCQKAIKNSELDFILIFGIKDTLLQKYQAAFELGQIIHEYKWDGSKKYIKGREIEIDQTLDGRILCLKY